MLWEMTIMTYKLYKSHYYEIKLTLTLWLSNQNVLLHFCSAGSTEYQVYSVQTDKAFSYSCLFELSLSVKGFCFERVNAKVCHNKSRMLTNPFVIANKA